MSSMTREILTSRLKVSIRHLQVSFTPSATARLMSGLAGHSEFKKMINGLLKTEPE